MSNDVAVSQPKNEVAVIFEKINSGLKAFEEKRTELTELVEGFKDLAVESVEDRTAISKVNEARKSLKKERVLIQNQGKAMRDPLTQVNKQISSKEAELVSIIEPEEKRLSGIEDWVESEKDRIKHEELLAAKQRIQGRIDQLSVYGLSIDLVHIETLPDDQFEKVVERAKKEHELALAEKEAERIRQEAQAEQDRKDREELQALRKKQEESDRILKEREEEITRKETELKRQQEEVEYAERKRIEEKEREKRFQKQQAEAKLRRDRVHQLDDIGGNGQEYFARYDENVIVCKYDELITLSDAEFHVIRERHNTANTKAKEEKRLAEEQRQEKIRIEIAEKALAQQKKREAEAAKQEAERLSAASDKDKYQEIVKYLTDYPKVTMNSAIYKKKLGIIKDFIADLK